MPLDRALLLLLLAPPVLLAGACAGGGGQGGAAGGGTPIDPPAGQGPSLPGLTAAAAGADSVRVDYRLPATGFDAALFQSTLESTVFTSPPVVEGLVGSSLVLGGLPAGTDLFFGLGLRPSGAPLAPYEPAGLVLRVRTGDPIYVDRTADPAIADGTTPGTAFADLLPGLLTAIAQGGGNVWVREGEYLVTSLPLFTRVHLYGGFSAGFDLAARDVATTPTVLVGSPGLPVLNVQGGVPGAVIDGIQIRGGDVASVGIDVLDMPADIRSTEVRGCTSRGIRFRNGLSDTFDVHIVNVVSSQNLSDGLSGAGAFDFFVDGSRFDANLQEGLEFDDLVAPEGSTARLEVRGSGFFGNATQGLDVDLAPPLIPGPLGGRFRVKIEGCRFELNGLEGLLIDHDYEFAAGWRSKVSVIDCTARANRQHGIHIDADGAGETFLHRVLSTGNMGDGLWVSSETHAGLVAVSASAFVGNLGAGMRASLGNEPIVATHCLLAGNFGGGIVSSTVESAVTSTVAYLQPNPWLGTRLRSSIVVDDPFAGTFQLAPEAYTRVAAFAGDTLTLADASAIVPGAVLETADDAVARVTQSIAGTSVVVAPAPDVLLVPGLLAVFPPLGAVDEDYHVPPGSPAEGVGMTPPGGLPVDLGPWGSPAAGPLGMSEGPVEPLFRVSETVPPLASGLPSLTPLEVVFTGGVLDPASLALDTVRAVTQSGVVLAIGFLSLGDRLIVSPPPGGWGSEPFLLEIHAAIRSLAGVPLSTPIALPISPM